VPTPGEPGSRNAASEPQCGRAAPPDDVSGIRWLVLVLTLPPLLAGKTKSPARTHPAGLSGC
jgi:hypothetical protein